MTRRCGVASSGSVPLCLFHLGLQPLRHSQTLVGGRNVRFQSMKASWGGLILQGAPGQGSPAPLFFLVGKAGQTFSGALSAAGIPATLFTPLDGACSHPLGMRSASVAQAADLLREVGAGPGLFISILKVCLQAIFRGPPVCALAGAELHVFGRALLKAPGRMVGPRSAFSLA